MIKAAPGAWPVFGHTPQLLRDPLAFLRSLPAYGDLVEVRIVTQKVIVVCDPGLTRQLLASDRIFDKGGPILDRTREVLGNGIGGCPHADHRRQRRALQPAFAPSRIPAYAAAMTTQSGLAVGLWRDGQLIDVHSETLHLSARIFLTALLSDTLTSSQLSETLNDLRILTDGIAWRVIMPGALTTLPTPGKLRYDRARARLRRTSQRVIAEYRATAVDHHDLLSMIINARSGDSTVLSDVEIEDQIMTFFVGGIETSSNTLAWTLYLLARHPEIQHRLHREVDTVLAGRPATVDDLPNLPLTGRIITEGLRLYPPGWVLTRTTTADTQLGGRYIPAGTSVAYSPYVIHHRPDVFTDPGRFDPDRWDDHTSALGPRSPIIPFGSGPRKCMGDTFAMTELCIALATISARFTLQSVSNRPVRPALTGQLRPRKFRLRVVPRRSVP